MTQSRDRPWSCSTLINLPRTRVCDQESPNPGGGYGEATAVSSVVSCWPQALGFSMLASVDAEPNVSFWKWCWDWGGSERSLLSQWEKGEPSWGQTPRTVAEENPMKWPPIWQLCQVQLPAAAPRTRCAFAFKDAGWDGREGGSGFRFSACRWLFTVFFFHFFFSPNCNSLPHHPSCKCDSYAFSSVTLSLNK